MRGSLGDDLHIESLLEFEAQELSYLVDDPNGEWEVEIDVVRQNNEHIRTVLHASRDDWTDDALRSFDELKTRDLVREFESPLGAKFYMFVSSRLGQNLSDRATSELKPITTEAGLQERAVTLHKGVGFCSFIIKAVSPSYEEVLPMVQRVQELIYPIGLHAWTLVVADHGIRDEGDPIDAVLAQFPPRLEPFIEGSKDPEALRRLVAGLPERQQAALAEIYARARLQLKRIRDLERFDRLLVGILKEDRRVVNQTLSFLTAIEGDLRSSLPRLIGQSNLLGPSKVKEIADKAMNPARSRNREPDFVLHQGGAFADTELAELFAALREACTLDPRIQDKLIEHVPEDWVPRSHSIVKLRNAYTHSRLTESLLGQDFDSLSPILDDLMFAIQFQLGVEIVHDRLISAA